MNSLSGLNYGIEINSIVFSRGKSIKRSLLNNELLTILRSMGIQYEQIRYIASGHVIVITNSQNLRVYTRYYVQQPTQITVNLIKFYKYQKNDNTGKG